MSEIIVSIEELYDVNNHGVKIPNSNKYYDIEFDGYAVKTNKQTFVLLINNSQNCCENWGCFSCNDDFEDFIGAELLDVNLVDTALNVEKVKQVSDYICDDEIQFVNFETSKGTLQLAVYNSHNGYYGHSILLRSEGFLWESGL